MLRFLLYPVTESSKWYQIWSVQYPYSSNLVHLPYTPSGTLIINFTISSFTQQNGTVSILIVRISKNPSFLGRYEKIWVNIVNFRTRPAESFYICFLCIFLSGIKKYIFEMFKKSSSFPFSSVSDVVVLMYLYMCAGDSKLNSGQFSNMSTTPTKKKTKLTILFLAYSIIDIAVATFRL